MSQKPEHNVIEIDLFGTTVRFSIFSKNLITAVAGSHCDADEKLKENFFIEETKMNYAHLGIQFINGKWYAEKAVLCPENPNEIKGVNNRLFRNQVLKAWKKYIRTNPKEFKEGIIAALKVDIFELNEKIIQMSHDMAYTVWEKEEMEQEIGLLEDSLEKTT